MFLNVANHPYAPFTSDNFALLTDFFNRSSDFHVPTNYEFKPITNERGDIVLKTLKPTSGHGLSEGQERGGLANKFYSPGKIYVFEFYISELILFRAQQKTC